MLTLTLLLLLLFSTPKGTLYFQFKQINKDKTK